MPLFASEILVGKIERMEIVESVYGNSQVEIEIENIDPEGSRRMTWLPIPPRGITSRTVLGAYLMAVAEVDKRVDGLDFRPAKAQKSLEQLFKWMTGGYYAFESRELGSGFSQKSKERWVPVRKFKSADEAAAYDQELQMGEAPTSDSSDVPDEVLAVAKQTWAATGGNVDAFKILAATSWPNVDVDALIAKLQS